MTIPDGRLNLAIVESPFAKPVIPPVTVEITPSASVGAMVGDGVADGVEVATDATGVVLNTKNQTKNPAAPSSIMVVPTAMSIFCVLVSLAHPLAAGFFMLG